MMQYARLWTFLAIFATGMAEDLQVGSKRPPSNSSLWSFPFSNCIANPAGSPYLLSGPTPRVVDGVLMINLTVIANPAADPNDAKGCYAAILDNLFKINVNSGRACVNNTQVVINGEKKRHNRQYYWDTWPGLESAVLRITHLKFTTAIGSTIDLLGSGPCNSIEAFAGPAGGNFQYYTTNSSAHRCCPVNSWDWGYPAPPPPSSLPPSPPPSLPPSPSPSPPSFLTISPPPQPIEESSGLEASTVEESSSTEGSSAEESSGFEASTVEESSSIEGSTAEESSGLEASTVEESSGTEGSSSEESSGIESSTVEESSSSAEESSGFESSAVEESSSSLHTPSPPYDAPLPPTYFES